MKKFIQVDGERVMLIHNMPFDAVNGMGKTEAELMQMGVLLDDVPEPQQIDGKIALPYYNATEGFHYIYEDKPQTDEEKKMSAMQDTIDMLLIDMLEGK